MSVMVDSFLHVGNMFRNHSNPGFWDEKIHLSHFVLLEVDTKFKDFADDFLTLLTRPAILYGNSRSSTRYDVSMELTNS